MPRYIPQFVFNPYYLFYFFNFSFVTNLKNSGKNGESKKKKKYQTGDDLSIHDSAVYLRNQVEKIIRQKEPLEIQAILTTLCTGL